MGLYINIGNTGFRSARNGEYVDKSGLISIVNGTLDSERRFSCISRARHFGKSMAAKMLCAYYDQSCDSRALFADLEIAKDPSFEKHLNKYPVIYVDMSGFVSRVGDSTIVSDIATEIRHDILSRLSRSITPPSCSTILATYCWPASAMTAQPSSTRAR